MLPTGALMSYLTRTCVHGFPQLPILSHQLPIPVYMGPLRKYLGFGMHLNHGRLVQSIFGLNFYVVLSTMKCHLFVCLILYIQSTIFQLYRDGSSWVEPVLS